LAVISRQRYEAVRALNVARPVHVKRTTRSDKDPELCLKNL